MKTRDLRYASDSAAGLYRLLAVAALTIRTGLREAATIAFTLLGCAAVLVAPVFDLNLFGSTRQLGAEVVPGTVVVTGLFIAAALSYIVFARERVGGGAVLVLSRPVTREAYVAGKLLGVETLLFAATLVVGLAGIASVALWGLTIDRALVLGVALALAEVLVIGAAAIFFATLGSLPLILGGLVALYFFGHLSMPMRATLGPFAFVFSAVVPRFDAFILTGGGLRVDSGIAGLGFVAATVIIGTVLFSTASMLVFRYREFS